MLDINELRYNFDKTSDLIARRNKNYNLNNFKLIDQKRREIILKLEELKNKKK